MELQLNMDQKDHNSHNHDTTIPSYHADEATYAQEDGLSFFRRKTFHLQNGEPLPVKGGNNSIENDFSRKKLPMMNN